VHPRRKGGEKKKRPVGMEVIADMRKKKKETDFNALGGDEETPREKERAKEGERYKIPEREEKKG